MLMKRKGVSEKAGTSDEWRVTGNRARSPERTVTSDPSTGSELALGAAIGAGSAGSDKQRQKDSGER